MIIFLFVASMRWVAIVLAVSCAGPIGNEFEEEVSTNKTNLTDEKKLITDESLSSQQTFREHVWPELKKSCGSCHAAGQTPFFASTDIEIARRAIIDGGKVDFSNIPKSRLVLRLSEDNHNCPDDCQKDANRFIKLLALWQKNTAVKPIDGLKTIELDPADESLSYDLSNIKINGQLLAEVELLSKGHGYLLRNLHLETNERLFVHVIKPLINDRWNSLNTTFLQLKCAINPPGGRLQGRAATTLVADNLTSINKLSFVFKELRSATDDDPVCRDDGQSVPQPSEPPPATPQKPNNQKQTDFFAKIRPIMVNSCQEASCHATTNRDYLFNYQQAWDRRSRIEQRITHNDDILRMPPANSDKELSDSDRNILLDWLVD